MRWLTNLIYRSKDPTRNWFRNDQSLVVELDRCTLAGVRLGEPYEKLSLCLGPSHDALKAVKGRADWPQQGVTAWFEDGRMIEFWLALWGWSREARYIGRFACGGSPVELTERTTESDLVALLGPPFARAVDGGEIILFYEYDIGEVQYWFVEESGLLSEIEMHQWRELGSAEARAEYGIDVLWPYEEVEHE